MGAPVWEKHKVVNLNLGLSIAEGKLFHRSSYMQGYPLGEPEETEINMALVIRRERVEYVGGYNDYSEVVEEVIPAKKHWFFGEIPEKRYNVVRERRHPKFEESQRLKLIRFTTVTNEYIYALDGTS